MFTLKLAATREYHPRDIEHFLHTVQKNKNEIQLTLKNIGGKVQIFTSQNLEEVFPGAKCEEYKFLENKESKKNSAIIFARQIKGSLLPIKRYAQFEDRVNKERVFPMDNLIFALANKHGSQISFSFKTISDHKRHTALKKAKKYYFKPDRLFDQWESRGWFSINFRRFIGPPLRKLLSKITITREVKDEKTDTIHEREDPRSAVLDKLSRPLFLVQIQMSHEFNEFLSGFTLPYLNGLKKTRRHSELILSAEELASLLNMPNLKNCAHILECESTAHLSCPLANPLDISEEDRKRHLYILGKTGMGKSTTILEIFQKDIAEGRAVAVLDPHGDLISDCLKIIPNSAKNRVILLDPSNEEYPVGINPLEILNLESPALKASSTTEIFQVLSRGSWGPRLEYILRNSILTLNLCKNTTLLDLPRLLTDKFFCMEKLAQIKDLELRRFWEKEFLPLEQKMRQEFAAPILNKVGPLLTSPILRNIFGQPRNKFNFEEAMDSQKIMLIPLPKGKLGEDAARMLGMIFISMIQSSLLKRATQNAGERKTFALFIDEFQNFCSPTLLSMLAESRKYGLALTLANQYITQIPPEVQDAVLGNVGSLISFRTSFQDAEKLAPIFGLTEGDLTDLSPFTAYAKLLKNCLPMPTFRFKTNHNFATNIKTSDKKSAAHTNSSFDIEKIRHSCLERYGRRKSLVEEKIAERYTVRKPATICRFSD